MSSTSRLIQIGVGCVVLCLAGCGFTSTRSTLTSKEIYNLTLAAQRAEGSIAVSTNDNRIAFSNGQNIFTIDLNDLDAQPVQRTNGTSAFTPSFLDNDDIVFGTINAGALDTINFQSVGANAVLGNPVPAPLGSINAASLRFVGGTPLTAPTRFSVNATATTGIGTINGQPFVLDFTTTPVGVTPLNDVFGAPIIDPVFSSDGTSFAATNANGNVISGPVTNGVILPSNILPVADGSFPSFTRSGRLSFFSTIGFHTANSAGGFDSTDLGSPAFTPSVPTFSRSSSRFFTTSPNGTRIVETTITEEVSTPF